MKRLNLFLTNQNVMIFLTVFAFMFSYILYKPIYKLNHLLNEQSDSIEYKTTLKEETKNKLNSLKNEEYKSKQAREQYKFSEHDEYLFEFPEEKNE